MHSVLLVGNPNVGKTSLFNILTKSSEHTGNWHGVTVEGKTKVISTANAGEVAVTDLPGLASLSLASAEENAAREEILSREGKIIYVAEAGNLACNLFLLLELIERGREVVLAVNMIDEIKGATLNLKHLSRLLGIEVLGVSAKYGLGVSGLIAAALEAKASTARFSYPAGAQVERVCEQRYRYIDTIMANALIGARKGLNARYAADKVLLNPALFLPIFLAIIAAVFFLTFGEVNGVPMLGKLLNGLMAKGVELIFSLPVAFLRDKGQIFLAALLEQGVAQGAGGIAAFLPQVAMLFLALNLMEDTGYMARVAYMADGILGKIGLSGKAAFTMLMGFGCTAAAAAISKNIEGKNLKRKTVMVTPFMSCGARLPVYSAITAAYLGGSFLFIMLLYFLGVVLGALFAAALNKRYPSEPEYILTLPPYRAPSLSRVVSLLWFNIKSFAMRIVTLVLTFNVLIWILCNVTPAFRYIYGEGKSIMEYLTGFIAPVFKPLGFGNWKAVTALLSGIVAKEAVAAVLASLDCGFSGAAAAASFLVFVLLYSPCAAALAAIKKEIGLKYTLIALLTSLALAYIISLAVYQIGSLVLK